MTYNLTARNNAGKQPEWVDLQQQWTPRTIMLWCKKLLDIQSLAAK
jgi:hypothetical protein